MRFHVEDYGDGDAELIARGRTPVTTRYAKKASVRKWRTLQAWLEAHPDGPVPYEGGQRTCALCHLFYPVCTECPVFGATGKTECLVTPYENYRWLWAEGNVPLALEATRREAEFLERL